MKSAIIACGVLGLAGAAAASEAVPPGEVVYEDGAVETSLSGAAGDAATGREVFADRKLGNCLACHQNADRDDESFHGEVGPELNGVADRWSEAELRGIVANAKMTFDGTIMPAFYRDAGFTRPLGEFEGQSILNAQQVEDIVAYLQTLKEE